MYGGNFWGSNEHGVFEDFFGREIFCKKCLGKFHEATDQSGCHTHAWLQVSMGRSYYLVYPG